MAFFIELTLAGAHPQLKNIDFFKTVERDSYGNAVIDNVGYEESYEDVCKIIMQAQSTLVYLPEDAPPLPKDFGIIGRSSR